MDSIDTNDLEKAKKLKDDEEFEESIKILEKLRKKDPENDQIKILFIETLLDYGIYLNDGYIAHHDKALRIFTKILEIEPKNFQALYNVGICHHNLEEYEEALNNYKKALDIEPNNKYCYYNIGLAYEDLKKYRKAIAYFEKALEIDEKFIYAQQAKHFTQLKLDASRREKPQPISEKFTPYQIKKLISLLKMSKKIKIDMLNEILELNKDDLITLLIEWGNKYGFELDGDFLIINQERSKELIDDLKRFY